MTQLFPGSPLTPTLSPQARRGSKPIGPLAPRERGEGPARLSGGVRGSRGLSVQTVYSNG
jgi:hypothetical protein